MADPFPRQADGSDLATPVAAHRIPRSMKASFSMSSLRDGVSPDQDTPGAVSATLPRRKHHEPRRRLRTSDHGGDEFWAAIQSNYEYLMDSDLIETCKEASGELSWDDEDAPSTVWTVKEFLARHERICEEAERLEAEVTGPEGAQLHHVDAIKSLARDMMFLDEQCQRLARCYPDMSGEIVQRMDRLNALWDTLQHCVAPVESHDEKMALHKEIAYQMRLLCKWIRGVEEQLGPLPRNPNWSRTDVQAKLTRHVVLQKEIESRGKSVLAVIKLCERFQWCCSKDPDSDGGATASKDGAHLLRFASNFERRFHSLWLRSLEWQCFLEQCLVGGGFLSRGSARDDSDSDAEEPYKKFPRLTGGVGTPSGMNQAPPPRRSRRDVGVAAVGDTTDGVVMVGSARGAAVVRPVDHHDVGYSSESSAHLSNEEGGGEFSRVYTYTSAEATSPRVLEVVMDGDCRPRKTPPRELGRGEEGEPVVSPAGPNCATFYFCHEDSDGDRRLTFVRGPTETGESEEAPDSVDPSDLEDGERSDRCWSRCPDGIHELVNEAERLVRRPSLDATSRRSRLLLPPALPMGAHLRSPLVDSSCDASGECTSSNDSDEDSSSSCSRHSSSSQEQKRSVIDLKADADAAAAATASGDPRADANSCGSDPGVIGVKMRVKKRRSGDRPWSVVELKQSPGSFDLAQLSNSETALHRLAPTSSVQSSDLACAASMSGDSSPGSRRPRRSTTRRRSIRKGEAPSDGKCRSLGSLRHSSSSENGRWRTAATSDSLGRENDSVEGDGPSMDSDDGSVTLLKSVDLPELSGAGTGDDPSSSSEPFWDDYQAPCYQSEPYSEPVVDEDAALKVWCFGDDYRSFIGSQSDGASTPSFPSSTRSRQKQVPSRSTSNESPVLDSESDLEDINEMIEQLVQQLRITEQELRELWQGDPSAPGRPNIIGEVLATCQTHIDCLRKVWGQLGTVRRFPSQFNTNILQTGETLRAKWERLLMEAKEEEEKLGQLSRLKKEAEEFRRQVENVLKVTDGAAGGLRDRDSLKPVLDELKAQQASLLRVKQALVELNFRINNFVTRTGVEVAYLKEQVVALYRLWDEAHDRVQQKLDRWQVVDEAWDEYVRERDHLEAVLHEDDGTLRQMTVALDKAPEGLAVGQLLPFADMAKIRPSELREMFTVGRAVEDKGELQKAECPVESVTRAGRRLQELLLEESPATGAAVGNEVIRLSERAQDQQKQCQQLVVKLAALLEAKPPTASAPVRRRSSDIETKKTRASKRNSNGVIGTKSSSRSSSSSLLWRVVRAALPIQLAVVILFCFACLLEPHCCESVNNLNLSLTPQLRYVRGPPPI